MPIKVRTMCPALIFAARRKDRVIGRTRMLTVSIRMRGTESQAGVLVGRSCAIVFFGALTIADISSMSHRGIA